MRDHILLRQLQALPLSAKIMMTEQRIIEWYYHYDGDWKNWNPKQIWVPSKKGLGMKKVFDDCNQIYGKDFIKYD